MGLTYHTSVGVFYRAGQNVFIRTFLFFFQQNGKVKKISILNQKTGEFFDENPEKKFKEKFHRGKHHYLTNSSILLFNRDSKGSSNLTLQI